MLMSNFEQLTEQARSVKVLKRLFYIGVDLAVGSLVFIIINPYVKANS